VGDRGVSYENDRAFIQEVERSIASSLTNKIMRFCFDCKRPRADSTHHGGGAIRTKLRIYAFTGGLLLRYWMGFNFSVAVWVGYIASFGIALETGW
jgi:hypothetical protein